MTRLTDEQVRTAADLLVALREERLVVAGLPADVTPDNTADVQRIIDAVSDDGSIGRCWDGRRTRSTSR